MVSEDRPTANHIVNDLLFNSHQYSFFQAVKLLNDYHQLLMTSDGRQELKQVFIQFNANPELAYNRSDIQSIILVENEEKISAHMTVNFLGLYGAVSPLPAFYSERILQSANNEDHTRHFMDLFNHRMTSLIYKCWEKYRYYQLYKTGSSDQFSSWMFALTGLFNKDDVTGLRNDPDIDWNRLLPFLGMLGMRCHSAEMIKSILKHYFNVDSFQVISNVRRMVDIEADQQNRLGMQCATLNSDLVLGQQVEDRCGKFRIKIARLAYEHFIKFLPGGEFNMSLRKLVNFILRDQLDYDIELQLLEHEVPKLQLSHNKSEKLGWTSWIGHYELQNHSVIIPGGL